MVLYPRRFPLLLLPLVVGVYLLSRSSASSLAHCTALLTLKPFLAAPLWLASIELSVMPLWTRPIPDVVLYTNAIATLLVLGAIRWRSGALGQAVSRLYGSELWLILSVSMSSAFAIVAWLPDKGLDQANDFNKTV